MADSFGGATEHVYYQRNWLVSELLAASGNKTSKVASLLGVTQRQVNRYIAFENGTGSQARSTKRVQGKINEIAESLFRPKKHKIEIKGRIFVSSENDARNRTVLWDMTDKQISKMAEIAANDGEEEALEYFGEVYHCKIHFAEGTDYSVNFI